jgi:serine/threonine-protein kinase
MGVADDQKPIERVPLDLLPLIQRSGILSDRQFEEVSAKVLRGEYPRSSSTLAVRLVEDRILTEFQARRLLRNKTHGFVVGRYVILDRLGEGNKGRVFKAQHRLMGRLVALKVIAPQIASRASAIARFYREMRLIGRLDHPNVVRAFDADQSGDLLYIVMEYVAGRSLDQVLEQQGSLPPADVGNYMAQAALGLDHAHDRGIVHRDVKPSNLLLGDDGQLKILDLGLSALMEADSETSFATAAGRAVGTLHYMSPEQLTARDIDGRCDLFSLGCTMYHLLTGQVPFPGETVAECLKRRVKGSPIPVADLRPDLPPQVVRVLEKLMAYRPEDRFQSAAEASAALQSLTHGEDIPRPDHRPSPHSASHAWVAKPAATPAVSTASDLPSAPAFMSPDSSQSSRSRFASLLGARPSVIILLILLVVLVVELATFVAGFTLGQATAFRMH